MAGGGTGGGGGNWLRSCAGAETCITPLTHPIGLWRERARGGEVERKGEEASDHLGGCRREGHASAACDQCRECVASSPGASRALAAHRPGAQSPPASRLAARSAQNIAWATQLSGTFTVGKRHGQSVAPAKRRSASSASFLSHPPFFASLPAVAVSPTSLRAPRAAPPPLQTDWKYSSPGFSLPASSRAPDSCRHTMAACAAPGEWDAPPN